MSLSCDISIRVASWIIKLNLMLKKVNYIVKPEWNISLCSLAVSLDLFFSRFWSFKVLLHLTKWSYTKGKKKNELEWASKLSKREWALRSNVSKTWWGGMNTTWERHVVFSFVMDLNNELKEMELEALFIIYNLFICMYNVHTHVKITNTYIHRSLIIHG